MKSSSRSRAFLFLSLSLSLSMACGGQEKHVKSPGALGKLSPPLAKAFKEDAVGEGSATLGIDPFKSVRSRELGRKIFEAIESLTPDHRAVILLREIDGLSYEEISEVLECSLGTVMSRLHYARKKLQSRLQEML